MRLWHKGEQVRLKFRGRSVDAVIVVASENGRSLALEFEAILGGYVGMMPILWSDKPGEFRDLVCNERVEVFVRSEH